MWDLILIVSVPDHCLSFYFTCQVYHLDYDLFFRGYVFGICSCTVYIPDCIDVGLRSHQGRNFKINLCLMYLPTGLFHSTNWMSPFPILRVPGYVDSLCLCKYLLIILIYLYRT